MSTPLDATRPRWGTFSVVSHLDARTLTADVLLYDRLIFPTPTRDSIRDWPEEWDAEQQEHRLEQLRGLVHRKRWEGELRAEWSRRWEELRTVADMTENPHFNLTMAVLADTAQRELEASPLAPVVVAAYQSRHAAFRDYAVTDVPSADGAAQARPDQDREGLQRRFAALFRTRLLMPEEDDAEVALRRAIELAHDTTFQQARRSLYAWQDDALARGWTADQAIAAFEERVEAHNEIVRAQRRRTVHRRVWRVASFLVPPAAGMLTEQPLISLGANGAMKLVEARFPSIEHAGEDPNALAPATLARAISAVCHD